MNDTNPEDYSAPRTPGQAEGTEGDVTGDGHSNDSTEEDVRQPTPGQAEGEDKEA